MWGNWLLPLGKTSCPKSADWQFFSKSRNRNNKSNLFLHFCVYLFIISFSLHFIVPHLYSHSSFWPFTAAADIQNVHVLVCCSFTGFKQTLCHVICLCYYSLWLLTSWNLSLTLSFPIILMRRASKKHPNHWYILSCEKYLSCLQCCRCCRIYILNYNKGFTLKMKWNIKKDYYSSLVKQTATWIRQRKFLAFLAGCRDNVGPTVQVTFAFVHCSFYYWIKGHTALRFLLKVILEQLCLHTTPVGSCRVAVGFLPSAVRRWASRARLFMWRVCSCLLPCSWDKCQPCTC